MDSAETIWTTWTGVVTENLPLAMGIGAALVVALVAAIVLLRRRSTTIVVPEADDGVVRRPRYLDVAVLSDVLAHVESKDHGRELRNVLEWQESTEEARATALRTEQVRALNKAISASRARGDLATVVDASVEELPRPGTVVEARGRLHVVAGTRLADLLVRARPVLAPTTIGGRSQSGGASPDGNVLTRVDTEPVVASAPTVAVLETVAGRLLMVLDAEALQAPVRGGEIVSVLGILDREVSRREKAEPQDYLLPHLPTDVRSALQGRDVADVAKLLAKAADVDLKMRDTVERGPGALITAAAIW